MPVFASRGVQRRPDPPPWETDDVPVVLAGTGLWVVALVVLLVLDLADTVEVHRWWLAMCVCGALLGLVGVRYCRRRQPAVVRAAVTRTSAAATAGTAAPADAPSLDRPFPDRPAGAPPRT